MTLDGREHEGSTSPRSRTSGTDSLLDELEEAGGRLATSLRYGTDGMSAADVIAAAVASASLDDELEYAGPSDTMAMVAMAKKASESTKNETAAAAVGGDGAAPDSPRGSSSSATSASAPVPGGRPLVVLAGGVESMSNIEYYTTAMRGGARSGNVQMFDRLERGRERSQPVWRFGVISGMIETAENLAADYGITREACDQFAAESHAKAAAAWAAAVTFCFCAALSALKLLLEMAIKMPSTKWLVSTICLVTS